MDGIKWNFWDDNKEKQEDDNNNQQEEEERHKSLYGDQQDDSYDKNQKFYSAKETASGSVGINNNNQDDVVDIRDQLYGDYDTAKIDKDKNKINRLIHDDSNTDTERSNLYKSEESESIVQVQAQDAPAAVPSIHQQLQQQHKDNSDYANYFEDEGGEDDININNNK